METEKPKRQRKVTPKVAPVEQKVFNTYLDVLNDPACFDFIQKAIRGLKDNRLRRKDAPAGRYYIRTGYDKLRDEKLLTAEFFKSEYPIIVVKKSNLSADRRWLIDETVHQAIIDTLNYYKCEKV